MKSAVIYLFKDKATLAPSRCEDEAVVYASHEMAGGENILQFPHSKHTSASAGAAINAGLANRAAKSDLPRLARLLGELEDQRINRARRISKGKRKLSVVRS